MASLKRNFELGGIYHIYNRGNHRGQIFLGPEDYIQFLLKAIEYAERDRIEILAYCLMSNHYHLLVRQTSDDGITPMMRSMSVSYAKYFNWQYEQVGHVYQGRYGCRAILDGNDLANVARYIHRNSSLIGDITEYRWSDLKYHLNGATKLLNLLGWTPLEYDHFVNETTGITILQPTSKVIL